MEGMYDFGFVFAFLGLPLGILLALTCLLGVRDKHARTDPVALRLCLFTLLVNLATCYELHRCALVWIPSLGIAGSAIAVWHCAMERLKSS